MTAAFFRTLARQSAQRYPARDRYARGFAYGKLSRDPAFRHFLEPQIVHCGPSIETVEIHVNEGHPPLVVLNQHEGRARHLERIGAETGGEPSHERGLTRPEIALKKHIAAGRQRRGEAFGDGVGFLFGTGDERLRSRHVMA